MGKIHCKNCGDKLKKSQEKFCSQECFHEDRSKHKSWKGLRDEAWSLLSKYVRKKAAGHNGMVRCYTCPNAHHYKDMDGGHWIHGKTKGTYLEETNIRPQCTSCNYYGGGEMMRKYTIKIQKELPEEEIERLEERKTERYTKEELRAIISRYKNKLEKLNNKKLDL